VLVRELVERFEQFAPKTWAEPGDPVGLQLGSLDAEVHKVMVTLDVRPEVVDVKVFQICTPTSDRPILPASIDLVE